MNLGRYIMDIRNKELKNTKEFIMKHAIATFIFVASIAAFSGFANALPIASTTGADASKSVALDQGANQWNHFVPRGGFKVALDQGANQFLLYGIVSVALSANNAATRAFSAFIFSVLALVVLVLCVNYAKNQKIPMSK